MTRYIWDVVSDNVLMETDDAGATTAVYTQEPDLYGKLISQHRDGQSTYYHFDGLGSTRAVTDESQNVVETATYSAFGEIVAKTSSITNPFGYKGALGYYTDSTTGHIQARARTYALRLGRYLSQDRLRFILKKTDYAYASNSPINRSDPSGLADLCMEPDTAVGIPWHSVGDLNFGTLGETFASVSINCTCDCIRRGVFRRRCTRYRVSCKIDAKFCVEINVGMIECINDVTDQRCVFGDN
ncbi:MAG: hypothetical protein O3C40_33995 [Planctomycetota bacterium]|nr:hypothetical protein [Planctomycetota bacterium]